MGPWEAETWGGKAGYVCLGQAHPSLLPLGYQLLRRSQSEHECHLYGEGEFFWPCPPAHLYALRGFHVIHGSLPIFFAVRGPVTRG